MSNNWLCTYKAMAALCVTLAIFYILAVRVHTYDEPLERDITSYAVIGHELLGGRSLYSDLWDHKPPAVHATFALGEFLVGYGPQAIFLLSASAALLTLAGLYQAVLWAGGGHLTGGLAALFWGLTSSDLHLQANQPNTEVFINLFLVWGIALSFKIGTSELTRARSFGAASCWAVASLYKMVAIAVPAFVVPVTAIMLFRRGTKSRTLICYGLVQLLVGLAVWLLVSAYFLGTDRFQDFYDIVFTYNRSYAESFPQSLLGFTQPERVQQSMFPLLACAALIGLILLTLSSRKHLVMPLSAFLLGCLVATALPGHNFPHYSQLLIPPLVLLCALGLGTDYPENRLARGMRGGVIILLLCGLLWHGGRQMSLSPEEWSRSKYGETFITSANLGQWLGKQTREGDQLYELGAETGLYFYSQRSPTSGRFYDYPAFAGPFQNAYSRRIVDDIKKHPPEFLILNERYAKTYLAKSWQEWPPSAWRELHAFVDQTYTVARNAVPSSPLLVLKKTR